VQAALDFACSWFRVGPCAWLVCTSESAEECSRRLEGIIKPAGHLFVCGVDLAGYAGLQTRDHWAWLKKHTHAQK